MFGSVVPALLKAGVGSVVAFSHSVHIKAARILVERFYTELAAGMTVGQALEESRAGLHANRSRWLHPGPDAEPSICKIGSSPSSTRWARTRFSLWPAAPNPAKLVPERRVGSENECAGSSRPGPCTDFTGGPWSC